MSVAGTLEMNFNPQERRKVVLRLRHSEAGSEVTAGRLSPRLKGARGLAARYDMMGNTDQHGVGEMALEYLSPAQTAIREGPS